MKSEYDNLLWRLNQFIRRYYWNRLLRGSLLLISILSALILLISTSEYLLWLDGVWRKGLFYLFMLLGIFTLTGWILVPLVKMFRLSKGLSNEQAASIIGQHFADVEDVLLNVIQLNDTCNIGSKELIDASISQKCKQLKWVKFSNAVNFKENIKYVKWAILPLFSIGGLLFFYPAFISDPMQRIVSYDKQFLPPVPYHINIDSSSLNIQQYNDFLLTVSVSGRLIPEYFTVCTKRGNYRMHRNEKGIFQYSFKNVQKSFTFHIEGGGYQSNEFQLNVYPQPIITHIDMICEYPKYINKLADTLFNAGDVTVPEGTTIRWKIFTRNADSCNVLFGDSLLIRPEWKNSSFVFSHVVKQSIVYSLLPLNNQNSNITGIEHEIRVVSDGYPEITVREFGDSIINNRLFYDGVIVDDYGFSSLSFVVMKKSAIQDSVFFYDRLDIIQEAVNQEFVYDFSLDTLHGNPGDQYTIYFKVADNDRINGYKEKISRLFSIHLPSKEEMTQRVDSLKNLIDNDFDQLRNELHDIKKDVQNLKLRNLENREPGWEEKDLLKQMVDKYTNMVRSMEEIDTDSNLKNRLEEKLGDEVQRIADKQKQLEKLFKEVLDDETRKLIDEIKEKLDALDKEEMNRLLNKADNNLESLEDNLDRNLALFKQLEFEKGLQDLQGKLDELIEKQDELKTKTDNNKKSSDSLSDEQQGIKQNFERIEKEMDDLIQQGKALENPVDAPSMNEERQMVLEKMKHAAEDIKQGRNKKATNNQSKASQGMKEMKQKLQNFQMEMEAAGLTMDMDMLRQILDNLVYLSFEQESLMEQFNLLHKNDPLFVGLMNAQHAVKGKFSQVSDSLKSLAKQQVMIQQFIMAELKDVNNKLDAVDNNLVDRNIYNGRVNQQYVMKGFNNLALMLSEVMQQMQQQMSMQNSGKGSSCPMPGAGKPSMGSMRKMQQALNKQLQGLSKGKGAGEKGQGMSEKLARMAAQQEAIRRGMEQLRKEASGQGEGEQEHLNRMIKAMEQTETDLVNKRITQSLFNRQKDIETRLLQAEKAQKEREKDYKRKSETPGKFQMVSPDKLKFKLSKEKQNEQEMLRLVTPSFKPYYRNKADRYLKEVMSDGRN